MNAALTSSLPSSAALRRFCVALIVTVGSLVFTASPALANASHALTMTIAGSGANALSGPTDVAVDQASHDVYVTDPGNYSVEKFDSAGNFILMFGKEVDKTKVEEFHETGNPHHITEAEQNVCTAASGDTCQGGTAGSVPGQFEAPRFLAVDNSCSQHEPPLTAVTTPTCEEFDPSAGDVYVADRGDGIVSKFNSSGHIVSGWGVDGQKNGSDAEYGPWSNLLGIDVGATGNLYVFAFGFTVVSIYNQAGTFLLRYPEIEGGGLGFEHPFFKVDSAGNLYNVAVPFEEVGTGTKIFKTSPSDSHIGYITAIYPTTGFSLDPSSGEIYQDTGALIYHYSADCNPANGQCQPVDSFGGSQLLESEGVAVDGASHTVYVANTGDNNLAVFSDIRPKVTTGPPSNVTETSVTLTGHIEPVVNQDITECHFEYGFGKTYGATVPCTPDPTTEHPFQGRTDVTATLSNLSPDTHDHYRLAVSAIAAGVSNSAVGQDETFATAAPPAIDGLASANLTATSADLNAQVNPNGLETTYRFEYGPTTSYGQSAPVRGGTISASNADQAIGVHLGNLIPHVVYHYRLVAENEVKGKEEGGTTVSEDHTFNFFPPSCPNENVRQQTQTNYLPDCRAYELVSPGDAGGTQLYPGGPNTGQATSPSRFSYTGLFSAIPNSGGTPIDSNGDLYVATRTPTGWVTRYVGLPSNQAAVDGGPPQGLPGSYTPESGGAVGSNLSNGLTLDASKIQNNVLTDPSMGTFLDFNDGSSDPSPFGGNPTPMASNAPYVWSAEGSFLDRWPTNLATVPDGVHTHLDVLGNPTAIEPGGTHALDCPTVTDTAYGGLESFNYCPGDVTASSDLSHFVFASEWNVFAPGGTLSTPGSVYDNDTATGSVVIASKTAAGDNIPAGPDNQAQGPLQIPAVSSDGSHILIAAGAVGPCGFSSCPAPPCHGDPFALRCRMQISHLYMRVNGAVTYDVSQGHAVNYVGMTEDGSKVFFTSEEQLTSEDQDTSTDLYMWSQKGEEEVPPHPLTLISKGDNAGKEGEPGNTDDCSVAWTTKCGVVTYSDNSYCQQSSGLGGNCRSDNSIASQSGDIYFFSPEQLDGSRGIANQENLYDYRNGQVQYVATLTTGPFCFGNAGGECLHSDTPVVRMQVSPDGSHMAFVTASPVTQYDNAGHLEMYTYEPSTRRLVCVSCNPSGAPATSDVGASQDGLFMTNDGRAFFSTEEALVHADTNHALDVYEYVDGRPQLITSGTGETREPTSGLLPNSPGLIGVSANGLDVYFSTYDTLVPQDHNGLFLKFYDARTGGGFPAPPSPPPCEAADECHGPGSSPPAALQEGTGAALAGGNVVTDGGHRKKGSRRKKRHRKKAHRSSARGGHAPSGRGGSR